MQITVKHKKWYFKIAISHFKVRLESNSTGDMYPLIIPNAFTRLWFQKRHNGNLVKPCMRVTNKMTRQLANLSQSYLIQVVHLRLFELSLWPSEHRAKSVGQHLLEAITCSVLKDSHCPRPLQFRVGCSRFHTQQFSPGKNPLPIWLCLPHKSTFCKETSNENTE